MSNVIVVILNYKTPDLAVEAAQSVADDMSKLGGAILIVDNASGDGSMAAMERGVEAYDWPKGVDVQVLQSGRNGGFGAGNNFGIRTGRALCSEAEFVYVLNPDAQVKQGALLALVGHLKTHPKSAIAGSWITDERGADDCSAFRLPSLASEFEAAIRLGPVTRLLKDYALPMHVPETSGPVGWVVGASMLMRIEALEDVGLFDETFFLYFEETDLCLRLHRAGYEVHFVRDSRVRHIGSVSTGMGTWRRTPRYWYQSRWYYLCKNHGRLHAFSATLLTVLGTSIWRIRRRLEGKPNTDAPRFLRDLIAHDVRAVFRSLPSASIQTLEAEPVQIFPSNESAA